MGQRAAFCLPLPARRAGVRTRLTLNVVYLQSWAPLMGRALFTCRGACACAPMTVDARRTDFKASVNAIASLPLTSLPESSSSRSGCACSLHTLLVDRTGSSTWTGGERSRSRFKVMGLTVERAFRST